MDHLVTIYFGEHAHTTSVFPDYESVVACMATFVARHGNRPAFKRMSWEYTTHVRHPDAPVTVSQWPVRWDKE